MQISVTYRTHIGLPDAAAVHKATELLDSYPALQFADIVWGVCDTDETLLVLDTNHTDSTQQLVRFVQQLTDWDLSGRP